jgi:hypothetical protein
LPPHLQWRLGSTQGGPSTSSSNTASASSPVLLVLSLLEPGHTSSGGACTALSHADRTQGAKSGLPGALCLLFFFFFLLLLVSLSFEPPNKVVNSWGGKGGGDKMSHTHKEVLVMILVHKLVIVVYSSHLHEPGTIADCMSLKRGSQVFSYCR